MNFRPITRDEHFVLINVYSLESTLILYIVYVLHWPDDGCFTAETSSPDVTDISSLYICCVLDGNIHIYLHISLESVIWLAITEITTYFWVKMF